MSGQEKQSAKNPGSALKGRCASDLDSASLHSDFLFSPQAGQLLRRDC